MSRQFQASTLAGQRTRTAALLVAGMHRSGTSALARVLSILGAELPKTLMRPGFDNPKGFWESEPIAALNDSLLAELGGSWDDALSLLSRRDELALRADVLSRASEALRSEFSMQRPVVLKEPRIALLLKVWVAALERESFAPRVIIPLRDPLEVCASLGARNGFSVGRSLLLWLTYVLEAERASRGVPRAIFRYEDLIFDWRLVARRLEGELNLQFGGWTPAAELEVDAFLSASDRHHVSPPDLLHARADVVDWVKRTYSVMQRGAQGEVDIGAELDAIAQEFQTSLRVFAPLLAEQSTLLKAARAEFETVTVQAQEAETQRLALRADVTVLHDALKARDEELQALSAQAADRETLEHALRRRDEDAARLQAALAEHSSREMLMEARLKHISVAASELETQLRAELRQKDEEARAQADEAERLRSDLKRSTEAIKKSYQRIDQFRANVDESMERAGLALQEVGKARAEAAQAHQAAALAREEAALARTEGERAREDAMRLIAQAQSSEAARVQTMVQAAEDRAANLLQWRIHAPPRKRFARLLRSPIVRAHSLLRAAALLSSGLYVPQDGPGGRAVVNYARGRGGQAHPLFDDAWYARNGRQNDRCAAIDYLLYGDARGADPHALFDVKRYRNRYRDLLVDWPLSTLEHYLMRGAQAGLSPHPLFDTDFYVSQARDVWEHRVNPLAHYVREGWRQGLDPHPLFSTDWYYSQYPDVRDAGLPALQHYVHMGACEGRDPHPHFSTSYYLANNEDVKAAGTNPLAHYVMQGWRDGRKPSKDFDPSAYLADNPKVAAAGAEPLAHFLAYGVAALETPRRSIEATRVTQQTADTSTFDALSTPGAALEDNYCWPAYERVTAAFRKQERAKVETFRPHVAALLDFSGKNLLEVARTLRLPTSARPAVSIIIPVYGQLRHTLECLASLATSISHMAVEVIVIDDASTDETPRVVPSIEGVCYVRNDENLGYLRTVNRAALTAQGETLVILNNDTQVERNWLQPLLDALKEPTIGIAAPKMLFPNGRLQEAGGKLKSDASSVMIGLLEDPNLPRYSYDRDVDYVSGACIAIRRADFETLGGFDDRYAPAYCEDSDLCMRVRASGKRVRYVANSTIYHHLSVSSDAQPNAYKMRQVRKNQQQLIERWSEQLEELNRVRVISFYLPQFHAIPENDRWWGAGFTEWRNVTRALPNFEGHYQPHRPAELGYYDISDPEVMERQAELARAYGVSGFCYYYYWFAGKRVLEAPLERIIETGKPDLPFCICWANENWTRTWDGQHKDVLLAQHHSDADDQAIIADMIRYMRMPSYIRINGKPLLVMYRPQLLPNAKRTMETWRRACREAGLGEIYLAMVEVFEHALTYKKPSEFGFDASIEFPPSGMSAAMNAGPKLNPRYTGRVSDYNEIALRYLKEPIPAHTRFRGVMPSWDNTARRQDVSYVFHNATPGAFQAWLEAMIEQTRLQNFGDERIVFVNAWNEWAEGAHLEPDLRFGRGWLEAVRNAQLADGQISRAGPKQ